MKGLVIKAKELLKVHSKEYVLEKLTREKTGRTTATDIIKIVDEAEKLTES